MRAAIECLKEEGQPDFAWWNPRTDMVLTQRCVLRFEEALDQWFEDVQPTVEHFHNLFFNLFQDLGVPEFQAARIFIHWIETDFHAYCEKFEDLDSLEVLEQAHMTLLADIHIWNLQRDMRQLQSQWDRLQQGEINHQKPPASAPLPRRPRTHPIKMCYHDMEKEELCRRGWRMTVRPRCVSTPGQGPYYIVHLYAGRRREDDFHAHMQSMIGTAATGGSPDIYVISIDTAISDTMDVHSSRIWSFLLSAARAGQILAMLLGPPCETWSNARFAQLLDADGNPTRGPRPLRSASSCWGLGGLSLAELDQIAVGNCLLLRGLWLCIPVAFAGGCVLLEHPAPPYQLDRPAIWHTGIILLLLRDGWMFRRHTFAQGRHGACGKKPTSLLHAHCPIIEVLAENAIQTDPAQLQPLIGKDDGGNYRTSKAKEYPANLCQCFATAFWRQISQRPLLASDGPLDAVAQELVHLSGRVDPARQMKADYQPKR